MSNPTTSILLKQRYDTPTYRVLSVRHDLKLLQGSISVFKGESLSSDSCSTVSIYGYNAHLGNHFSCVSPLK